MVYLKSDLQDLMLRYGAKKQFPELSFYENKSNETTHLFWIIDNDVSAIRVKGEDKKPYMVNTVFRSLNELEQILDSFDDIRALKENS